MLAIRARGSSSANGQRCRKTKTQQQFSLSLSLQGRKVLPRPLKDGLRALLPFQLGSASLSPSSCLLPASTSAPASLPSSTTLLQLLQLPGHHHSRHHWLVPLCLAVHRDLGCAPVDVVRFATQYFPFRSGKKQMSSQYT